MNRERSKRWLEIGGSLAVVAAVALAALAATPTSNIPISQMPIATEALETAWFPIIQPYPGRLTNDNFRVAASNLFTRSRTLINATNITVNGTNVATVADLIWTNDQGRVRVRPELVPYFYTYPSNFYGDGWFALEPVFQVLGSGTNTLDTKDSSYLMFSMTNDPAEVIVELTAGYAIGQELLLMSYTNTVFDGRFTLPANSVVSGGGFVKLNNNQDWLGANGSAMRLIWIEPDWWEQGRWFAGDTNQPGQVVINPTDGFSPYRIDGQTFGDSLLEYRATNYSTLHGFGAGLFIGSHTEAWYGGGLTGEAIVAANIVADGDPDDLEMLITSVDGANSGAFHVSGSSLGLTTTLSVSGASPSQLQLSTKYISQRLDTGDSHINFDPFGLITAAAPFYFNQDASFDVTNALAQIDYRTNTQFRVNIDSGYDGSTTKYLNAAGYYTVPAGGGGSSDNWVASGSTNSTLPGIGSAYALIGTNGIYSGNGFYAPWWTPSADDTFVGIHDVSLGDSDYSFLYVGNVDNGMAETNYADFTVTTKTSSLSPAAMINLAAVATNDVSTFVVSLQPDQNVARIELYNRGAMTFNVADTTGYATNGHKALTDNGTYIDSGLAAVIYTNIFMTNLAASTDHDIYTIPAGYRGVNIASVHTTNTTSTTVSYKVKISGTYYTVNSSANAQTNSLNSLVNTFVYEPGDVIAVNANQMGLDYQACVTLIPDTNPLKSVRTTSFIVGDNTLYTVPAGKMAIGAFKSSYFTAAAPTVTANIYHTSGGNIDYLLKYDGTLMAQKTLGTATINVIASIGAMSPGSTLVLNSSSTDATQFAWVTVYEIDQ